ncbi:MFS transporter [Bacillus manliponensis]
MKNVSEKPFTKDFRIMIIGQIISIVGSSLLRFILALYVLDLTGRADIFAMLYAISSIPLLLAPLGGALADRFNRRNLMVILDIANSLVVFVFFFLLLTNYISIIFIGIFMFLLAVISTLYAPLVMASIPLLVPQLFYELHYKAMM